MTADAGSRIVFDADKLVEIRSFPDTDRDTCFKTLDPKTGLDRSFGAGKEFVVIHAVTRRGAAPEFKIDKESAPCK